MATDFVATAMVLGTWAFGFEALAVDFDRVNVHIAIGLSLAFVSIVGEANRNVAQLLARGDVKFQFMEAISSLS